MPQRPALHGVLLVDKPAGITSAEVVRRVKHQLARGTRVGHLGTLDPFATGLLPILIGEATKLAPFLQEGEKEYVGVIRFGAETDSLDPTGTIVRTAPVPALEAAQLAVVSAGFTGVIEQIPPVFSALKRDGVRLYELARRGGEVPPPAARRVEIRLLELSATAADSLQFRVRCTTGTYVRSLARDIGRALDSAAYLLELRRTRNGIFEIGKATPLDAVIAGLERGEEPAVTTMREALADMAEVEVTAIVAGRIRNGDASVLADRIPRSGGLFKVVFGGDLIAIARATSRVTATLVRGFVA
ncbi:MAG TPA: tRNA pseudouridine(55) synthase TruB [Candidatus Binataceae bacterium]|nr:tRNA pseudouridine(55) synthase TruB [Candidatus Binataceae bacterium]